MTNDDRDSQIAHLIRSEISKVEINRAKLRYPKHSPEDALLDGKITGLRIALGFVDPQPWR